MKAMFAGSVLGTLAVLLCASAVQGRSERVLSSHDASAVVVVADTAAEDSAVSGVLLNKSQHPIRDVALMIRYQWFWKNEFHPGSDNPGRATLYSVRGEIAPGGRMPFTYQVTPPLPSRTDGYFRTSVEVVGFSEVGG